MSIQELVRRYLVFFCGLAVVSLGIAFVTKGSLGTSPISAIPYTLSLIVPALSLGNWTIVFSALLVVAQLAILRRQAKLPELGLQLVLSVAFGYTIDAAMWLLELAGVAPATYPMQVLCLLVGCAILAFGAYLQVIAGVVMLPGDAFVRAVSQVSGREFGAVRVMSDCCMTAVAAALCLAFLGRLSGVREGTVVAALLVGNLVRVITRALRPLTYAVLPENRPLTPADLPVSGKHFVITVSREYGSGGHAIGQAVAERLGVPCYDSQLIRMAASEAGYAPEFVRASEESATAVRPADFFAWYGGTNPDVDPSTQERLFHAEELVIREIAARESCVIVGRLANRILADHPRALHVFVSANMDDKVARVMEREGLDAQAAAEKIRRVDRERAEHSRRFAHAERGRAGDYDVCLNSSAYGVERTADVVVELAHELAQVRDEAQAQARA